MDRSSISSGPRIQRVHRHYVTAEGLELPEVDGFLGSDDVALRFRADSALVWDERESLAAQVLNSSGTVLPAHPDAKDNGSPLVVKGRQMVASAKQITQFFNRDSSDALQPTADTALVHYLSKPKEIGTILTTWQRDAQQIWSQ